MGVRLQAGWPMGECYLVTCCSVCEPQMDLGLGQRYGSNMAAARRRHGSSTAAAWQQHGGGMEVASPTAWWRHGSSMAGSSMAAARQRHGGGMAAAAPTAWRRQRRCSGRSMAASCERHRGDTPSPARPGERNGQFVHEKLPYHLCRIYLCGKNETGKAWALSSGRVPEALQETPGLSTAPSGRCAPLGGRCVFQTPSTSACADSQYKGHAVGVRALMYVWAFLGQGRADSCMHGLAPALHVVSSLSAPHRRT